MRAEKCNGLKWAGTSERLWPSSTPQKRRTSKERGQRDSDLPGRGTLAAYCFSTIFMIQQEWQTVTISCLRYILPVGLGRRFERIRHSAAFSLLDVLKDLFTLLHVFNVQACIPYLGGPTVFVEQQAVNDWTLPGQELQAEPLEHESKTFELASGTRGALGRVD